MSAAMQQVLGDRASTDPSGVDLFRSLAELGLKLEAKTSSLEYIVIDRIERPTLD